MRRALLAAVLAALPPSGYRLSSWPGGIDMNRRTLAPALAVLTLLPAAARCDPPRPLRGVNVANILPLLDTRSPAALSGALREVLIRHLPDPLYEALPGWGRTTMGVDGIHWRGRGLRVRPEVVRRPRNDGTWRKVRVTAPALRDTLVFELRDVRHPSALRLDFRVFVSFDVRAEVQQQQWETGTRLYSASLRAKARVKLTLDCEAEAKLEAGKGWVPDAVFRLRVTGADLRYDNLQVEHVAGIGGTAARLLGEVFRSSIGQLDPSLEKDLLARANEAVIRAGGEREVRVNLTKLLKRAQEMEKAGGK
jgi:hypothetical protein